MDQILILLATQYSNYVAPEQNVRYFEHNLCCDFAAGFQLLLRCLNDLNVVIATVIFVDHIPAVMGQSVFGLKNRT